MDFSRSLPSSPCENADHVFAPVVGTTSASTYNCNGRGDLVPEESGLQYFNTSKFLAGTWDISQDVPAGSGLEKMTKEDWLALGTNEGINLNDCLDPKAKTVSQGGTSETAAANKIQSNNGLPNTSSDKVFSHTPSSYKEADRLYNTLWHVPLSAVGAPIVAETSTPPGAGQELAASSCSSRTPTAFTLSWHNPLADDPNKVNEPTTTIRPNPNECKSTDEPGWIKVSVEPLGERMEWIESTVKKEHSVDRGGGSSSNMSMRECGSGSSTSSH